MNGNWQGGSEKKLFYQVRVCGWRVDSTSTKNRPEEAVSKAGMER
jgi:hypothetical protein